MWLICSDFMWLIKPLSEQRVNILTSIDSISTMGIPTLSQEQ